MFKAKRDEEDSSVFEAVATSGVVVRYHFLPLEPS